jgi:TonB family protein
MKKLSLIIILLAVCGVSAQTDDKETLKRLNQNVISFYNSGNFDEALKAAREALDLSWKTHGAESPETALAYTNLGVVLREKKKFKESAENLQKTVEIYRKDEARNAKELVDAYYNLAISQLSGGMKKEAEANYLKTVATAKIVFGKESKEIVKPLVSLAALAARTGGDDAMAKSMDYYLESFALAIKHYGKDSPEVEEIKIYKAYYQYGAGWKNDEQREKYSAKEAELFGYKSGKALDLPIPRYPPDAKMRGIEGTVVVKVWINEKGKVTNAKAVYGETFFAPAVEEAAGQAKFEPSTMNGKPVAVVSFVTYRFFKA